MMARSFGLVEEKMWETDFFLDRLRETARISLDARFYFSAFVSAARSVTLVMQACLKGVDGFDAWYESARNRLKSAHLAPYFVEIRNDVIHNGMNPLNSVTLEHLQEDLARQVNHGTRSHVIVLPAAENSDKSVLADAEEACICYFSSLVSVVYDCYWGFRTVVDPQWYFTEDNFNSANRSFEDALLEMGFPDSWAEHAPDTPERWAVLRRQYPCCQLNELFDKYLGKTISDPDKSTPS